MKKQETKDQSNKNKPWTGKEKRMLRTLNNQGKTIGEIAQELGRSPQAVSFQKNVLGIRSLNKSGKKRMKRTKNTEVNAGAGDVNVKTITRDQARDIAQSAREIARVNGKRITMAMFFVEDL